MCIKPPTKAFSLSLNDPSAINLPNNTRASSCSIFSNDCRVITFSITARRVLFSASCNSSPAMSSSTDARTRSFSSSSNASLITSFSIACRHTLSSKYISKGIVLLSSPPSEVSLTNSYPWSSIYLASSSAKLDFPEPDAPSMETMTTSLPGLNISIISFPSVSA